MKLKLEQLDGFKSVTPGGVWKELLNKGAITMYYMAQDGWVLKDGHCTNGWVYIINPGVSRVFVQAKLKDSEYPDQSYRVDSVIIEGRVYDASHLRIYYP